MMFGLDLGRCHPSRWPDLARAADEAGFESLWLGEHLIMPASFDPKPVADGRPGGVPPQLPCFDAFAMLASLAAITTRIRVGTNVYNIGLRHPFVTARAAATVDIVSTGRLDLGVGASWLPEEWSALELDFASRGSRVDESIRICRRLWSEQVVAHRGTHYRFDEVVFEPKPVQDPLPIHVGGDSSRALRRAVELGDGWIGMIHDPQSFAQSVSQLRRRADEAGRDFDALQRTAVVARPSQSDIDRWHAAGATRLIVAPWQRTADAIEGALAFADLLDLRRG